MQVIHHDVTSCGGCGEFLQHALGPRGAAAFNEDKSPGAVVFPEARPRLRRRATVTLFSKPGCRAARAISAATAPIVINSSIRNSAAACPDFAMAALRFRTELAHLTEHGDATSVGVELDERAQRGFGRIGIRVVAVVDELDAADLLDLQTRFGERRRGETDRALLERKPKNASGGDGEHRILHHVQSGHRKLRPAAMRALPVS